MYKNIKLTASIMCFDWLRVSDQLVKLENEFIDNIHYDIVDGVFASDFTMGSLNYKLNKK